MGAELGSMRVTEQIDAMEVSAINPYHYLVVTRVLATTLMVPLLAIFADAIALLGGYLAMNIHDATTMQHFFHRSHGAPGVHRYFPRHRQDLLFRLRGIGIIGCYKGYNASRGTESVGIAANSAVVAASLGYSSST
jgi:phospholipid/cholesterol/gamma-HCH transport system permease protein